MSNIERQYQQNKCCKRCGIKSMMKQSFECGKWHAVVHKTIQAYTNIQKYIGNIFF